MSDLDLLRSLGGEIVAPPFHALREIARRRTRQRATATVGSAAAAVAIVAGATFLTAGDDENSTEPIGPPDAGSTTHPLTYAQGTTIHYGDQTVTAPAAAVELDVTDDGVVARTEDGGIWFTDGTDIEQVGTLGEPTPEMEEPPGGFPPPTPGFVVSPNTGSQAAWFEFPQPGEPVLVVFDTHAREESLRTTIELGPSGYAALASVTESSAYWFTSREPEILGDDVLLPDARVDLATGKQETVTTKAFEAETQVPNTPRTMMLNHAEGKQPVKYWIAEGIYWQFDVTKDRVEPQGAQPLDARDGGTGKRFAFDAPAGYPEAAPNWLTQWLDDDTVVVTVNRGGHDDLLECHFSTGACTVAVRVPEEAVMPEIG